MTYLQQVQRNALLGTQGVQVNERVSEARHVVPAHLLIAHVDHGSDIVLLHNSKARAQHDRINEAMQNLLSQTLETGSARGVLVLMRVDLINQGRHQVAAGLEDVVLLVHRDEPGHLPRELLQGRDHGFDETFRAVA